MKYTTQEVREWMHIFNEIATKHMMAQDTEIERLQAEVARLKGRVTAMTLTDRSE